MCSDVGKGDFLKKVKPICMQIVFGTSKTFLKLVSFFPFSKVFTCFAGAVSLRLGHAAALICHRHIIHYRVAALLPGGRALLLSLFSKVFEDR